MSTWSEDRRKDKAAEAEQRRLNKAAEAEQRRKDADAEVERRAKARAAEDARRQQAETAGKAQKRAEKQQRRRDRRTRRGERVQAWKRNTTPATIYRRGTLVLVTASALASLPAQVAHFAAISLMLLPVPFALEGAAWVMAAGVAYADEKGLPGWVRWLLRGLALAAAGYAASINYQYGTSLPGLTASQAHTAGLGLAGVTLGGPAFFEVRQWVMTLSAGGRTRAERAEDKARAKHTKKRRRDHKAVTKMAERLISAAPFGTLTPEDAFRAAWEIVNGTAAAGMTPALHVQAARSRQALEQALAETGMSAEAAAVEVFLADVFGPGSGPDGGEGGTPAKGRRKGPSGPGGGAAATTAQAAAGGATAQVDSQMPPASRRTRDKAREARTDGRRNNGGTPPRRRRGDTQPYSDAARRAMSDTARRAATDDTD